MLYHCDITFLNVGLQNFSVILRNCSTHRKIFIDLLIAKLCEKSSSSNGFFQYDSRLSTSKHV